MSNLSTQPLTPDCYKEGREGRILKSIVDELVTRMQDGDKTAFEILKKAFKESGGSV